MPEEIFRLISEFVEDLRPVLIAAFMKLLNWVHQHHPVLYAALGMAAFVVAAFVAGLLILQTWHVLTSWWSTMRRNRSNSCNIELGGEPTRVITGEHWKHVLEALAWAVVAAFAMLLLQARQVARWGTEGRLGILVVVLLFGVAMSYLRRILFSRRGD